MIFKNDELVKRELSNIAGLLVVRGGRLVALGSALFQVVRHIKFNRDSDSGRDSEAGAKLRTGDSGAGESQTAGFAFVVEKQKFNETEGSDANKI